MLFRSQRARWRDLSWPLAAAILALLVTCQPANHSLAVLEPSLRSLTFAPAPAFAKPATGSAVTLADVAERVVPSVVNISAERVQKARVIRGPFSQDPFFRDFFFRQPRRGIPQERRQKSLGSGVIVSHDGVVLTNNHVIAEAKDIRVSLSDGRELEAKLLGADPKSDLAVLKLQGDVTNLSPLEFGDSSAVRLGDVVMAIGNPFGVGQTVTMGIVSAKGRGNVGIVDYEDFLQTDAAINPGNSGGALVNMRGELIGVNTAILSRSGGYQGIGFAIPAELAQPILESLTKHGKVVRGWLGVSIQTLTEELATGLGVDAKRGVLISDVSPDGPAARAGIRRGDVIVGMNGRKTTTTAKLRNQIAIAGPEAVARLEVVRGSEKLAIAATLGELPNDDKQAAVEPATGVLDGATLAPLSAQARQRFSLSKRINTGVVVTDVEPGSKAARLGLRAGDVMLEVNRRQVKSPDSVEKILRESNGAILLLVQRGEGAVFLTLRP